MLRRSWNNQGVRAVVEETLLSSARLVRAFANLDSGLAPEVAGDPRDSGAGTAQSKSRASPRRKRSRSPSRRTPPRAKSSTKREKRSPSPTGHTDDSSFEEEGEEETPPEKEARNTRRAPGSAKPPEPPGPPPRKPAGRGRVPLPRKKKKKRRGGAKHQRHYREQKDPFRASHRKLGGSPLRLATSFAKGLERRA